MKTDNALSHGSVDQQGFLALRDALESESSGVRTFVVVRDGRIAFEHYRSDAAPDTLENVNSVTKSVVGLAVGIAVTERRFASLDTPVGEIVEKARDPALDERVRRITLRHLLTMTSGFECEPGAVDQCLLGACDRLAGEDDRLNFVLSRPMVDAPGTRFRYDSHAVQLLSLAIEAVTGATVEDYVREKLFAPLGIETSEWIADEAGHTFAGRGLMLRARDMTKLGTLMMDRGAWRGAQIVDASFIDDAMSVHSEGGPPMHGAQYGYLWWIAPHYVFAAGFGEQFIFVARDMRRDKRIVASATCDNSAASKDVRALFEQHVLGLGAR
ncbi:serine hydrolase [Caballeronia sp. LZ062]|uniref:serine hydrolase domain-containing protein n=1 Tax=unclassified Caballeronia TaxID=2646786 RepID=UPI0028670DB2|nr:MULTISPECIES: serine hydrolase [unclassified Caballeronia]MDR5856312.1 serine hydrolase [Caballeronia sp. LZ050]MDR5872982.1 serine hydrolase [Caballeronia sp. LZ062]